MDVLTTERLVTLLGFLAVLLLVWGGVRFLSSHPVKPGAPGATALAICSVKNLGNGRQAVLLRAAGHDVLVITQNKAAPAVLHLPTTVAGEVAA